MFKEEKDRAIRKIGKSVTEFLCEITADAEKLKSLNFSLVVSDEMGLIPEVVAKAFISCKFSSSEDTYGMGWTLFGNEEE